MKKKILVAPRPFNENGEEFINLLEKAGFDVVVNRTGKRFSKEQFLELAKDADGIIAGNDDLSSDVLSVTDKLKIIAKYGVGLDNIDVEFAQKKGITVKKALGANSASVAEMTMLLILVVLRRFQHLTITNSKTSNTRVIGKELKGKTLGIMGLGAIGRNVAKYSAPFGVKLLAYDPFIDSANLQIKSADEVSLLKASDIITLHMPLTDDTENLIDEKKLALIKRNAAVINTARPEIVDERAMISWLKSNPEGFYAEDAEPGKRSDELIALPNYLLTSHAASFTKEADQNTMAISVQNIIDYFEENSQEQKEQTKQ